MENNQRRKRQKEGIKHAQMKGVYAGRKPGTKATPDTLLKKYENIAALIDSRELSIRAIAKITNHSINTVRKINKLRVLSLKQSIIQPISPSLRQT